MSYISVKFLLFLVIVFMLYFVIPKRQRWIVLLLASLYFYAGVGLKSFLFIVFSATSTYLGGLAIDHYQQKIQEYKQSRKQNELAKSSKYLQRKKLVMFLVVVANIGILCYLKYINFVIGNINSVFSALSFDFSISLKTLFLPLGLSFYTFQVVGYILDVSKGTVRAERNYFKYFLFASFFPQIIQGPISRYDQLAPQLYEGHDFDWQRVKDGLLLIMWGYFKKLVIADRAAIFANEIFNNYTEYAGFEIFMGLFMYGIQLYADFSGGIDTTRGIAQVVGIDMVHNFQRPFFSRSVGEYWNRWHMTLGNWMRDYVYYSVPMAKWVSKMSKKGKKVLGKHLGKTVPGFIATTFLFIVIGIWHDASWNYVAFGLCNGILVGGPAIVKPLIKKINTALRINTESASWKLFQMVRTFLICMVLRVSHSGSLRASVAMIKSMFSEFNPWIFYDNSLSKNFGLTTTDWHVLFMGCTIFFVVSLLQERGYHIREFISKQGIIFRWAVPIFLIFATMMLAILDNDLVGGFLYAQF